MPNVFIGMNTAGPGAGAIFIRGIGYADIEKTQSPQVAVVIDGVFQGSSTGQLIDTFDVEQIEVNRGPQGVLFGKNTSGGTIVVTRVRPEFNDWGYALSGQLGNYAENQLKARINIPLIDDTLALKIGGVTKARDGYADNETRGGSAGDVDYNALTAALRWAPNDATNVLFTYDRIRDHGDIPPQDPLIDGDDPFKNAADLDESQLLRVDSLGIQADIDLGFATLYSITGISDSKDEVFQDFDGSTRVGSQAIPLPQLHTLRSQDFEQITQELRLSGDVTESLRYTVGAYYYETKMDFFQGTNQVLQLAPPAQIGPLVNTQETQEEVTSYAAFGAVNWNVTEAIELSAGVRWLKDEKEFEGAFFGANVPADPIAPPRTSVGAALPGFPVADDDSWDEVITKFTATWRITDTNMLFASYGEGFRSGGFSNRGNDPRFLTYEPETADAFEIGSKNDLLDGRLRLNASAFFTKVEGAQFSSIVTTNGVAPGTNTIINNGGETEIWGFEIESTAAVSDNLTLIGTFGYQDNESEEFQASSLRVPFPLNGVSGTACNAAQNPQFFGPGGTNTCPSVTLGGGDLGRSPKWNWSFTAAWNQPLGQGTLNAALSVRGQDEFIIVGGATSSTVIKEDGYTLIDARASYDWEMSDGQVLRVSLFGKNLADKEYREQALPLGNGGFQGWGPPRTYALEVLWQR
jgi:iron complex outermembrane receptor protein